MAKRAQQAQEKQKAEQNKKEQQSKKQQDGEMDGPKEEELIPDKLARVGVSGLCIASCLHMKFTCLLRTFSLNGCLLLPDTHQ